jgi:diguanylate cyclase (GGDEF)-like protein
MEKDKYHSEREPAINQLIDKFIQLFGDQIQNNSEIISVMNSSSSVHHHNKLIRSHLLKVFQDDDIETDDSDLSVRVGKSHIANNLRLSWYVASYNLFFDAYHEVERNGIKGLPSLDCLKKKWLLDIGTTLDTYHELLGQGLRNENSKLKRAVFELDAQANTDPLTEILNRRGITEFVDNSSAPGAFVLLDLDDFKSVNDLLGHVAGDEILRQVAHDIRSHLREDDIVARIGGDEFCIWIPISQSNSGHILEAAIVHIMARVPFDEWSIAICGGMALRPQDGTKFEDLYLKADSALYKAKSKGNFSLCRWGSDAITSIK